MTEQKENTIENNSEEKDYISIDSRQKELDQKENINSKISRNYQDLLFEKIKSKLLDSINNLNW